MKTDDLDFHLPAELIAQDPPDRRTASRLMYYRRSDGSLSHHVFSDLPNLLRAGDLLVFNDARVLPARFALRKSTGGRVDALFLGEPRPGTWHVLLRNMGSAQDGVLAVIGAEEVTARITHAGPAGEFDLEISPPHGAQQLLERIGRMPLPPYIHREKAGDERDASDRQRYQTVFAKTAGAVAAPTAALHFDQPLLAELSARGIEQTFVTLHVGMGTFKPVTAGTLEEHAMHSERYEISEPAAAALNRAKTEGRRIIAVGTTSARVLESQELQEGTEAPRHEGTEAPRQAGTLLRHGGTKAPRQAGTSLRHGGTEAPRHEGTEGMKQDAKSDAACFQAKQGETGILIYPPYRWRHVDALLTNFHLPRSTLIALVAAFVGLDAQRRIYQTAIEQRYRFFSFGDAMLLE